MVRPFIPVKFRVMAIPEGLNFDSFIIDLLQNDCDDIEKLLVGNKSDAESLRTVSTQEAQRVSRKLLLIS